MSATIYQGRVLRQWWDDASRTYYEYSAAGVLTFQRPYTASENALADLTAVEDAQRALDAAQRAAVKAIITDLQAEKTAMDAVLAKSPAQITGGDTKAVAKSTKRVADAAIDLARLLKDY